MTHYQYSPSASVFQDLRQAFEWMTDIDTAAAALLEVEMYRRKTGEFGRALARKMATDGKTSPGMSLIICTWIMSSCFYTYSVM